MEFWFVTTDHLTNRVWFRDEEDFKVGMNFVAVLVVALSVDVLAFSLMSNHVHFILSCTKEEAALFIRLFKTRYSQYSSGKYGMTELLRLNPVDFKQLNAGDESLERAIAYVQMNSVAANICLHPSQYPWGTGSCFFNCEQPKGRPVSHCSARGLKKLIHSKAVFRDLPGGPVVKTQCSQCRELRFDSWLGN